MWVFAVAQRISYGFSLFLPCRSPVFFCVNAARWWTISMGFPVVMGDPQSSPWLGWFGGSRVAMYQPLMWGLHQWGYPPKWMGYFMDNPMKMDDLGVPTIYGNPLFCSVSISNRFFNIARPSLLSQNKVPQHPAVHQSPYWSWGDLRIYRLTH